DGCEVDRSAEGHCDPRLDVEAVEAVEHVDVLAVGHEGRAIRLRKVDAQAGGLRRVRDRQQVGRKRLERLGTACVRRCWREQGESGGGGDGPATERSHRNPLSTSVCVEELTGPPPKWPAQAE